MSGCIIPDSDSSLQSSDAICLKCPTLNEYEKSSRVSISRCITKINMAKVRQDVCHKWLGVVEFHQIFHKVICCSQNRNFTYPKGNSGLEFC